MKKKFPIVLGCDNNYVKYALVTIQSIAVQAHKQQTFDYMVHVLHEDITITNQEIIKLSIAQYEHIEILFVKLTDFKQHQVYCGENIAYINASTYYRMFIPTLFPQYERILYLDCDIIVNFDIAKDLEQFNFNNKIMAAVTDRYIIELLSSQLLPNGEILPKAQQITAVDFNLGYYTTRLKLRIGDYFNAGVIYFNLQRIRELQIEQYFIDIINEFELPVYRDQDLLNYIANKYNGYARLDRKHNFYCVIQYNLLKLAKHQFKITNNSFSLSPAYLKFYARDTIGKFIKKFSRAKLNPLVAQGLPYVSITLHYLSPRKPWQPTFKRQDKYLWWGYAKLLPEKCYNDLIHATQNSFSHKEAEFIAQVAQNLKNTLKK